MITADTPIEELMSIPGVIRYFIIHGCPPITCSDTYPGTLGRLLALKKVPDPEGFITGLNRYVTEQADQ